MCYQHILLGQGMISEYQLSFKTQEQVYFPAFVRDNGWIISAPSQEWCWRCVPNHVLATCVFWETACAYDTAENLSHVLYTDMRAAEPVFIFLAGSARWLISLSGTVMVNHYFQLLESWHFLLEGEDGGELGPQFCAVVSDSWLRLYVITMMLWWHRFFYVWQRKVLVAPTNLLQSWCGCPECCIILKQPVLPCWTCHYSIWQQTERGKKYVFWRMWRDSNQFRRINKGNVSLTG